MDQTFEKSLVSIVHNAGCLERYGADGLTRPSQYVDKRSSTKEIQILPFQLCPTDLQIATCQHVLSAWRAETECSTTRETYDFITKNFVAGDIFYILTQSNDFIGCVALDRKNFYPYLTHLYVRPDHRKQGYARLLVDFIRYICRMQRDADVRLNCSLELYDFYNKLGFVLEESSENDKNESNRIIMKSNLMKSDPMESQMVCPQLLSNDFAFASPWF